MRDPTGGRHWPRLHRLGRRPPLGRPPLLGESAAIRPARRIENLPPYLFAEVDRRIAEKRAAGFDVISLGIGDLDLPTPEHVVRALEAGARDAANHRYPDYYGLRELRVAI